MHRHYNYAGGPRPHDAIVGAHAVLLGARRLNLKGDVAFCLVGHLQGAGDLLVEFEGELELGGVDVEEVAGGGHGCWPAVPQGEGRTTNGKH